MTAANIRNLNTVIRSPKEELHASHSDYLSSLYYIEAAHRDLNIHLGVCTRCRKTQLRDSVLIDDGYGATVVLCPSCVRESESALIVAAMDKEIASIAAAEKEIECRLRRLLRRRLQAMCLEDLRHGPISETAATINAKLIRVLKEQSEYDFAEEMIETLHRNFVWHLPSKIVGILAVIYAESVAGPRHDTNLFKETKKAFLDENASLL